MTVEPSIDHPADRLPGLDLLFVSNYSPNLDQLEGWIGQDLEPSYAILTYRASDLENAYSYEAFLEANGPAIRAYPMERLLEEHRESNLFFPVIAERNLSDYNTPKNPAGHRNPSYDELVFFIKSFTLFMSPFVKKARAVFSGNPDNFVSDLAFVLARQHKKLCLSFNASSPVGNTFYHLVEGLAYRPFEPYVLNEDEKSLEELGAFIASSRPKSDRKFRAKKYGTPVGFFGIISPNLFKADYWKKAFVPYKAESPYSAHLNVDRPPVAAKAKATLLRILYKLYAKFHLKYLAEKELPDAPFVYFPLQIQPEASTLARAPYLANQTMVIELLTKAVPPGTLLAVKEHPLAMGTRHPGFYREMKRFPNLVLLSDDLAGKEVIPKAALTVGYGGTSLFESVLLGKKYFMLCDFSYMEGSLIRRLRSLESIHREIGEHLALEPEPETLEKEKREMLNYFYRRAIPKPEDGLRGTARQLARALNRLFGEGAVDRTPPYYGKNS